MPILINCFYFYIYTVVNESTTFSIKYYVKLLVEKIKLQYLKSTKQCLVP